MGFSFFDPMGLFSNSESQTNSPDSNVGMAAMAGASRDAAISQSNAQLLTAQTQAAVTQLGILQNSQQTRFQTMAWLTERLDGSDTKLQIAVENAKLQMEEQTQDHEVAMKTLELDARESELQRAL